MKNKVLKLLNLHPGEELRALHFSLLAFLWACGTFCALTLSEGFFLEKIGAHILPYYYLTSACIMPFCAFALVYCLNFFRIDQIFLGILSFALMGYLLCSSVFFHVSLHERLTFYYFFKLFCTLLCSITLSSFWSFIDEFYDMQTAKRVFCLFNSTLYFGDACGGLLVVLILPRLGPGYLMILIALILSFSLLLIRYILGLYPRVVDDRKEESVAEKNSFQSFFATLFTSPFTLAFVGLTLLTYFICSVTEFNYQSLFERAFKVGGTVQSHALTVFMGKISFAVSLANMIFGLTCYSRIVKKMGVNNLAPFTSVMFILLFTSWHFIHHIVIGIIGFAIVEGVVYAIDDNNFNLLLNAVPTKIKYAVRIFLDSFVEHMGLALGGIFLLIIHPSYYLFLGLLLSFICLFTVLILKSAYPVAIYQNLVDTAIYFEHTLATFFKNLEQGVKNKLQKKLLSHISVSSPCFLSYEMLLEFQDPQLVAQLIRRAEFLSLNNKLKVLSLFKSSSFNKHPLFIACVKKWLHTYSEPNFKMKLYFYLALQGFLQLERAEKLLQDNTLKARLCGATALLQRQDLSEEKKQECIEILHQSLESNDARVQKMSLEALEVSFEDRYLSHLEAIFQHSQHEELLCRLLSKVINSRHLFLEDLLLQQLSKSSNTKSRQYLITSLLQLGSSTVLPRLVKAVNFFRTKERTHVELNAIPLAIEMPEKLLDIVLSSSSHHHSKILAFRILKLSHPQIVELYQNKILLETLEKAKFYKIYAYKLRQFNNKGLDKLQTAITSAFQNAKELSLQLLLMASALDKVDTFLYSLRSCNEKARSQALESLEKACPQGLIPLFDEVFILPPYLIYSTEQESFWKLLRQLYNQIKFSPANQDRLIASVVEQEFLFPGMNLPSQEIMKT